MDPVTLIVTAVALGASAGLTDTASSAIKDAYGWLKRLLHDREIDVSSIERRPSSAVQQDALNESLRETPDVIDDEVLQAAEQVTHAVAADHSETAQSLGVDLRDVQAEFVRVRSISSEGTGFRGEGLNLRGGLDIGDITSGRPSGNGDPPKR